MKAYDPVRRREQLKAVGAVAVAVALLVIGVKWAGAAGMAGHVDSAQAGGKVVTEWGTVTNFDRGAHGWNYVAVKTDQGHVAGAMTVRKFWRGQRVRVLGRLDGWEILNPQIR